MNRPVLAWPVAELQRHLAPLLPGIEVEVLASVDSTNSELMRRARAGQLAPTLLIAEAQSAGRGRLGRDWQGAARPGDALTCSLGLPLAPRHWSGLSLAVGLTLAESLHPEIGLKWPNDLWWHGRKLAGVLVETAGAGVPGAPRSVVIGVGLNVAPLAAGGFATAPAWLQQLRPEIDAAGALLCVAAPLAQTLRAFAQTGFAPLQGRYAARDVLAGQAVRLSDGTEGVALGVGGGGELLVQTKDGLHQVHSAEVSVRPLPPGAAA